MTQAQGNSSRLPIAILISGRGGNMRAIAARAASGASPIEVRVVVSDQPQAPGLALAENLHIPTRTLAPRECSDRAAYDAALLHLVSAYQPALIVLAGFMRILSPTFIDAFPGKMLNVHPSLLPKHRGLHTHRRALEAADTIHGASVHFVTAELDGGPVIIQALVDVLANDTEAALSARVQQQEHRIYPQAVDWFASGRLTMRDGCAWLDGAALIQPVIVDARSAQEVHSCGSQDRSP